MARLSVEEQRAKREAKRRDWESAWARRWLLESMPDDPELRQYVHALGLLLVVQRKAHALRAEGEIALDAFLAARAALVRIRDDLEAWESMLPDLALEAERASHAWRSAEFRRAHDFAGAEDVRRDHDAHVWAWYREKWRCSP